MSKLLKYEIRKTAFAKLVVLGITLVLEAVFLVGLALGERQFAQDMVGVSTALLVLTAIFGVLFIGLQSVLVLHQDMNTKQGYMLFMTPRSSYEILGAKVLEQGFSILLAGSFFFLLGFLDLTLIAARHGEFQKLQELIQDMIRSFDIPIDLTLTGVAAMIFSSLASWFASIITFYCADIISSSLLNGKRFNGLLTFALVILMNTLMSLLINRLPDMKTVTQSLVLNGAVSIAIAAILYCISARLMDRYLSV